jgi:hypothetical protein
LLRPAGRSRRRGENLQRIKRAKRNLLISGCLLMIGVLWLALYLQFARDRDQARQAAEVNAANLAGPESGRSCDRPRRG